MKVDDLHCLKWQLIMVMACDNLGLLIRFNATPVTLGGCQFAIDPRPTRFEHTGDYDIFGLLIVHEK